MSEAELAAVTVGAVRPLEGRVRLMEPHPEWPRVFAAEAAAVGRQLGSLPHGLAHVGSTSVPGLPAKPVVDMLLTVPDPADEGAYVPALEALGYRLAIREPDWFEHRVLRREDPAPGAEGVNLHVFPSGCPEVERMLTFRDRLRARDEERDLYARTKRALARRTWAHTQHYADAKSATVEAILARARRG
ncbi:GrpB family protein [Streptomyces profundus]|nr:GrpB family protein [Streptomyces sp. MA3_2.13]